MVIPLAEGGGGTDHWARFVGQGLTRALPGQPGFAPVNDAGWEGIAGTNRFVASAEADRDPPADHDSDRRRDCRCAPGALPKCVADFRRPRRGSWPRHRRGGGLRPHRSRCHRPPGPGEPRLFGAQNRSRPQPAVLRERIMTPPTPERLPAQCQSDLRGVLSRVRVPVFRRHRRPRPHLRLRALVAQSRQVSTAGRASRRASGITYPQLRQRP